MGNEKPRSIGKFYGKSYVSSPPRTFVRQARRQRGKLLVVDLNLNEIQEARAIWQFPRDGRPESYGKIARTQSPGAAEGAD